MPRLLHVTDTHLGAAGWFRGAPPGWSRAVDHLRSFRAALEPALRGDVDLVVHSGDLFDRSMPPPAAIAAARALLAEVAREVPVVMIPGNHDRLGLTHTVGGLAGITVADRPTVHRVAGLRLGLLPWLAENEAWAAAASELAEIGVDLLVCHATFSGTRVPGYTFREGFPGDALGARAIPRGVRHILCGHIHPRQSLRLGGAEVVCAGSTERTSFVERREQKGVVHWELGREVRWRYVDVPTRPMHQVDHPGDLAQIGPEELVLLGKTVRNLDMEEAVRARGGWVSPWKVPSPQVRMFPGPTSA